MCTKSEHARPTRGQGVEARHLLALAPILVGAAPPAVIDSHDEAALRRDGTPLPDALVCVARADNADFAGPAPIDAVVRRARGPSGTNRNYVLRLAAALRALGVEDEHVFALAGAVARS